MQKKTEIHDLDIPKDDIECWDRYPKHRWTYDLSRLLDAQHINWSPFETKELFDKVPNMYLETNRPITYEPGQIFITESTGKHDWTEVFIVKGEIKHIRHIDIYTLSGKSDLLGEIELRINAFVTLHFQKFTGVISIQSMGTGIYSVRLRPISNISVETNPDIIKLIKRIYKKNDLSHITGPTGQVFHEALAS